MENLYWILGSTFLISLGALAGIVSLAINIKKLQKMLLGLVALSAGALMGGAFLHLLPEALENIETEMVFEITLLAFAAFFVVEKLFHWRHCHKDNCEHHVFGYMNLVGDSIHNFIDGIVVAAAFIADVRLGIVTTLAVAMHEIPQEIGDFGVLIYAGFSRVKALMLNFLVALTVVLGGLMGLIFSSFFAEYGEYLLPFAAGGFLYIGAADLLPEIRKEPSLRKSMAWLFIFVSGIIIMWALKAFAE